MASSIKTTRCVKFDNIKGILMMLVIMGHALRLHDYPESNILYRMIYIFHMPVFVFVTGMFAKCSWKKIRKLLLCYILFQPIYLSVFNYIHGINAGPVHMLFPYHVMWYLFSTVLWMFTLKIIDTENKKKQMVVFMISVVGVLLSGSRLGETFLSISRTFSFYPFFVMGFYYRKNGMKRTSEKKKQIIIVSLIEILIVFTGIIFVGNKIDVSVFRYVSTFKNYGDVLLRYAFLFFSFIVLIFFLTIVPDRKIMMFTKLGSNTLGVYLVHVFIIHAINQILAMSKIQMNGWFAIFISVIEAVTISALFAWINEKLQKRKMNK